MIFEPADRCVAALTRDDAAGAGGGTRVARALAANRRPSAGRPLLAMPTTRAYPDLDWWSRSGALSHMSGAVGCLEEETPAAAQS
jgi:hypothetical protein